MQNSFLLRMIGPYRNCSHRQSSVVLDLALLSTIPLVQAIINDAWLYSPIGWLDPWYYMGYGLNYLDPMYLNDYYKVSRLPWIFLEFAARNTLDPVQASWVLQIGTLALGSSSLYLLFTRTLGRDAAFIGAAVFAAFPFAHANGGADYQNALAGPVYALTWWLVIRTIDLGIAPKRLFWIGVCAAITIHTNVLFANLILIAALHFLWAYKHKYKSWPSFVPLILWPTIGAIILTLVLGVINKIVGRDFLFFSQQFNLAGTFISDSTNQKPWWHPWSSNWYFDANYLGPFLAALLFASITFIAATIRNKAQVAIFSGGYVLAGLLWIFWQSMGQTSLDMFYFAYALVFPFTGAVAAAFAYWAPQQRPLNIISKLAIAVMIGGIVALSGEISKLHFVPKYSIVDPAVYGVIFLLAITILPIPFLRLWAGVAVMAICIAFGNLRPADYAFSRCSISRASERAIDNAHRKLRSEKEANGFKFNQIYLWAEGGEGEQYAKFERCAGPASVSLGLFEMSLASTGFNYLEVPWSTPRIGKLKQISFSNAVSVGGLVAFITTDASRVDQLMQQFVENGSKPTKKAFYLVDTGGLQIPIYTFVVGKK